MSTASPSPSKSAPVRVPRAAADYTPAVQDPDLRSQINAVLLRDGHIAKIQESLSHALHASPTNWPTRVHDHALSLLRSGECVTFPSLMERVLADIRADTEAATAEIAQDGTKSGGAVTDAINGQGKSGGATDRESLAVPRTVVEDGVQVTRECLDLVCEIEE